MKPAVPLLIGSAIGAGLALYFSRDKPASDKGAAPKRNGSYGLAGLGEARRLHAALTRNAKRSNERDDLVPVVAHYRSYPGTSLVPR